MDVEEIERIKHDAYCIIHEVNPSPQVQLLFKHLGTVLSAFEEVERKLATLKEAVRKFKEEKDAYALADLYKVLDELEK